MRTPRYNSPSAINTLNKCRRKYYYKYKLGIPEQISIEMLLGNIVHEAIKIKAMNSGKNIEDIFNELWEKNQDELKRIKPQPEELKKLHEEYRKMALNWQKDFDKEAVYQCEVPLKSDNYQVIGVIDEISKKNGNTRILDNKTSRNYGISKDHETQLAIYALLYSEKYGKLPDHLGIRFLRDGQKKYIKVDDKLINKAKYECQMMRIANHPDYIHEYPRNQSPLCNWGRGKCSYLERCFP